MPKRLKVVFDTNVYLAAAINPAGPSEAWLRIASRQTRSFNLYVSEPILDEVAAKLIGKFSVAPDQTKRFTDGLRESATLVAPKEKLKVVESDPDDDMLFECALAIGAHLIVSSDKAVLKINPYRRIGVCHPSDLKNIFAQDL